MVVHYNPDNNHLSMSSVAVKHSGLSDWIHPALVLKQTPHGVGIYAKEMIPAGTYVIQAFPLLLFGNTKSYRECANALIDSGLLDAHSELREAVEHLAPRDLPLEEEHIYRKFNINAFEVKAPWTYSVLSNPSFFNHSCYPNVDHMSNFLTEGEDFYTLRPIFPGEELTITYDSYAPINSREARTKRLGSRFQPDGCECKACVENFPPSQWFVSCRLPFNHCWWCGQNSETQPSACERCRKAHYCDNICASADFINHQSQCERLSSIEPMPRIFSFERPGRKSRPNLWLDVENSEYS